MGRRALVVAACLLSSGCAALVAGGFAGAVTARYVGVKGNLEHVVQAPLPEVETATRAAFSELGLVAVDGVVEGLEGELTARMSDGRRVWVVLEALDFDSTAVSVRVGVLGSRPRSEMVLRHIERVLAPEEEAP